jgi:hypothetical protein
MRGMRQIEISPEEDLRMLEEYRENEVIGLMKEHGIDEELANRYFAVLGVVRNFQSRIALMSHIPYDGISYSVKFDWESESVNPLRRYPYKVNTKVVNFDRMNWVFAEIGIDGYDEDGSLAFSAHVIYRAVPMGGNIRHQH